MGSPAQNTHTYGTRVSQLVFICMLTSGVIPFGYRITKQASPLTPNIYPPIDGTPPVRNSTIYSEPFVLTVSFL